MAKREAFIWRESVYKNKFKCNICGNQVADPETGEPTRLTLVSPKFGMIQCPRCRNVVARIEMMEVPEDMSGLQGSLADYERREKHE